MAIKQARHFALFEAVAIPAVLAVATVVIVIAAFSLPPGHPPLQRFAQSAILLGLAVALDLGGLWVSRRAWRVLRTTVDEGVRDSPREDPVELD